MGSVGNRSSMKVEIQWKKLLKPSIPTPPHLQSHKISSIDQLQPPFYITLIFHFSTSTNPEKLARLESSLGDVLSLYYPFAGRFDGEWTVSCQDQGIEFVKATIDGNLSELVDGDYDSEILVGGLSRFSISGMAEKPLILVQVNTFNCGESAIGFCCHHKMADMFTISTFMDAWATTCRLGPLANLIQPSFDLSSLLPPKDDILVRTPPLTANNLIPPPKFVMKRFTFKGDALSKLKLATIDGKSGATYTRVELVTAIISNAIINIDRLNYGHRVRPYTIAHMISLRKRITLPVKENSCGNLYMVVVANPRIENNEQLDVQGVASVVRNSIRSFTSEIATIKDGVAISTKAENGVKELDKEVGKGEDVNLMMFSSWCRFPLYGVDFGWGTPDLIKSSPTPFVSTCLMDSKDDADGIDAWVCLKEDDMIRFQHDSDILVYTF